MPAVNENALTLAQKKRNKYRIPLFILRILLGSIFVYAAISKLMALAELQVFLKQSFSSFDMVLFLSLGVPSLEIVLGISIITSVALRESLVLALLMLVAFTCFLLLRDATEITSCPCLGNSAAWFNKGWGVFVRNGVLASISLLLLLCTTGNDRIAEVTD